MPPYVRCEANTCAQESATAARWHVPRLVRWRTPPRAHTRVCLQRARAWAAECAASITTICVRERDRSDGDGGCACMSGSHRTCVGIRERNCLPLHRRHGIAILLRVLLNGARGTSQHLHAHGQERVQGQRVLLPARRPIASASESATAARTMARALYCAWRRTRTRVCLQRAR